MGREKKTAPGVGTGDHAKERHKRDRKGNPIDWTAPLPPGLVARPAKPQVSSRHKSWFEFVENKDKKKKLEFEFTERREPPPGFEFVPIGNPALTTACKELSREQDAMIFIVTSVQGLSKRLSAHLNRAGHHIRQTIVEQARAALGDDQLGAIGAAPGLPEPIPERQEDINKQADAAIRDLFPRIPNTDRQMIIEHAFNKLTPSSKEGPPVGLAAHVTLSRRVQLAVLAHIRHNHTRYDQLLRETAYVNARKAVESLCLDILVKWRGDEETGRDQLDEILCEVIVISDSESDESDDDDEEDSSAASSADESPVDRVMRDDGPARPTVPPVDLSSAQWATDHSRGEGLPRANHAPQKIKKSSRKDKRATKWAHRGFRRYQAARDSAWHRAVERQRLGNDESMPSNGSTAMDRPASHGPQPRRTGEPSRPDPGLAVTRSPVEPPYHAHRSYGTALPSVDVSRERGNRVNELQQTNAGPVYHMPQQIRMQETTPSNGFRSIVGSRTDPYGAPEVERVSYHGQDLKDYIVQSIEPTSPGSSNSAPRFPAPYRQPEPKLFHAVESPLRRMANYRDPAGTAGSMTTAQGTRPTFAEEGFIRLPPRSDGNRMPIPLAQHPEPFILLNPKPATAAGGSAIPGPSGGLGLRHSSTWQDDAAAHGDQSLKLGTRPVWVGHDGAVLRSESRPIIIQDYPSTSRQARAGSAYVSSENRLSPTRWIDARHAGLGWVEERDRRHIDSRIDQRIEALPGDFEEIVRVSNKFPRQYEPRPVPYGAGRHDLRYAAPQQGAPQQPNDGAVRYDTRHLPAPGQRVERVVGRVEVPAFPDENAPFAVRPPDGYQRQERVVGIEYVHPRPSIETRTYLDRGPFYDARDPAYRSRSHSAVPVPYPGLSYQSHIGRPTPKRDEVITLD
ncbi:hypothetical protein C8A00DRAFT_11679 [Chaetomidium leptoderma]|uniref:DUF2293 domain-containing protein n=1 Tax=Chaetomidium leptoderma TaxID=669021 RepID=A0AAN7A0E2_9PEZI|nr:hypothetical protein C8A00DRAFT_11679 [Chaetomidium leptoderma]